MQRSSKDDADKVASEQDFDDVRRREANGRLMREKVGPQGRHDALGAPAELSKAQQGQQMAAQ